MLLICVDIRVCASKAVTTFVLLSNFRTWFSTLLPFSDVTDHTANNSGRKKTCRSSERTGDRGRCFANRNPDGLQTNTYDETGN